MGAKISVDSATMMNKGLELIEACQLFPVAPTGSRSSSTRNRWSIRMVEYVDGSMLAQLGPPDMRVPIAHCLAWPDRMETPCAPLDLVAIGRLDFEAPDRGALPGAARWRAQALEAGGARPAILNAANEVAVAAFLARRIGFLEIAAIVADTLERYDPPAPDSARRRAGDRRRGAEAGGRACEGLRRLIANPGLLLTIVAFLLVIGPLVFVHELGHYLAGRWFGVKADAFSIGFGRRSPAVTDKRGTRWKFGWLPLGGYVQFAGDMNPASQPIAEWLALPRRGARADLPGEAGLAARDRRRGRAGRQFPRSRSLILAGFALAYGDDPHAADRRRDRARTAPPQRPGCRPGDRIAALGGRVGRDVRRSGALRRASAPASGSTIDVERGGDALSRDAVDRHATSQRDRFGNEYRDRPARHRAGARRSSSPVGLLEAPGVGGARRPARSSRMMVETLGQIITGRRSVKELGGPLKIAKVSGEQLSLGLADASSS